MTTLQPLFWSAPGQTSPTQPRGCSAVKAAHPAPALQPVQSGATDGGRKANLGREAH